MVGGIRRRSSFGLMAGMMLGAPAVAMAASKKGAPLPDITIYHLEGRRSERIVWMMEELGLPYKLMFKRGDLAGSMALIKAINPDVPMAPTVQYGDQILVESGAIMDLIVSRHAPDRLRPMKSLPITADLLAVARV